jgi:hypothetical protein
LQQAVAASGTVTRSDGPGVAATAVGERSSEQTPVSGRISCTSCGALPGELGDHGADLFVAGGEQKGRGSAVALGADDVEARFGMGELGRAVGWDGAARVHVEVDHRGQRAGALQDGVDVDTQLGHELQIGSEPGGVDDPIERSDLVAVGRDQRRSVGSVADAVGPEPGDELHDTMVDDLLSVGAQATAFGELVVGLAAEHLPRNAAADDPRDLGPGIASGQHGQVTDGVLGGVSGADDGDATLGIAAPVAAQHVEDSALDQSAGTTFTDCRASVGAERIGREPGAGGVDHGSGDGAFEAVRPFGGDDERCLAAAGCGDLVGAGAG